MLQTRIYLLLLLILASAANATITVDHCRCTSKNEGNIYERRLQAHQLQVQHGHESVKIDSSGYYVVNGVRILPPAECEYHHDLLLEGEDDDNLSQHTGLRTSGKLPEVFVCDTLTTRRPPSRSSMPKNVEAFLRKQLIAVAQHAATHQDANGATALTESQIDCQTLPKAVLGNRRALPFHCRCPANVDARTLSSECLDRVE